MAASIQYVQGLDQLLANLQQLPRELASRNGGIVRRALGKAAKVIQVEAQQRAPERLGVLKKNIITVRDRNPRRVGATERYAIAVRKRKMKYGANRSNARKGRVGKPYDAEGDAFYWRFSEFGTGARRTRAGANRGHMRAQPFMRPAFEARKQEALTTFVSETGKGIQLAVRKMKKGKVR